MSPAKQISEGGVALTTAVVFTIIWFGSTHSFYSYRYPILFFGDGVAFPAIIWFIGLLTTYFVFTQIRDQIQRQSQAYFITTILYWIVLIFLETVAYHHLYIQNLGTAAYPGLPFCDCIHAPVWLQLGYILAGPIYLLVLHVIETAVKRSDFRFV